MHYPNLETYKCFPGVLKRYFKCALCLKYLIGHGKYLVLLFKKKIAGEGLDMNNWTDRSKDGRADGRQVDK